MSARTVLVAAALVLGLSLLAVLAVVAPAADSPSVVTVESTTSLGRATIEVNGMPGSVIRRDGYSIRRATLTDRLGRLVGRSHLICVLAARFERSCWGTYSFPRGHITVAGPIQASSYTLAITGGTGLYDNARGFGRVTPSGESARHRVFFQLVG